MGKPEFPPRNPPRNIENDAQRLVYISASDFEPLATGKPLSLKEFGLGKSVRDLPCLVKVQARTQGFEKGGYIAEKNPIELLAF